MQLVLKELRESLYWLKLVKRAGLITNEDLQPLLSEAEELIKIIAKILFLFQTFRKSLTRKPKLLTQINAD